MDFDPDVLQALLEQDLGKPVGEIRAFRAEALKKSLLKKFVNPGNRRSLELAALDNFVLLNEKVRTFSLSSDFLSSAVFLEWKRVLGASYFSGPLQAPRVTLRDAFANGYCGPGASVGADNNLFFTKMFNSHLTTTSSFLYDHYHHSLNPRWARAEKFRQESYQVKVVPGSKMSSVPKDRTKNRTTCTEPILNMFYQLGIKSQIESILIDRFNINLSTQPDINKLLARRSSSDGSLATIDMKDASDSISVALCHELLPPCLMRLLMYTRSARSHIGKELVELSMISTMGNGFTFALMTWIFASLVRAIYNLADIQCRSAQNFGVFGDDIIVLTDQAGLLVETLECAGLTVNVEKSFLAGPFRESCGGDYFLGHDVRGVYIRQLDHETHFYSAFNRLHFWALRHNFELVSSLTYLKNWAKFRPVPWDVGVDAGFVVSTAELTSPKRNGKGSIKYHGYRYQPLQIGMCGERFRNHHGGLIAFLGGYVRDDTMQQRAQNENAKSKRCIVASGSTPRWDWTGDSGFTARELSYSWTTLLLAA
jgi:hypothetical protein